MKQQIFGNEINKNIEKYYNSVMLEDMFKFFSHIYICRTKRKHLVLIMRFDETKLYKIKLELNLKT